MSTSRGTKRSREDDDDQQQAKADLRLRCTLPGQNYAKFHSSDTNARDLIYRTAGHDAQLADAPPAETAVVWCGDMNDGLNSAKVRFNLDLATQYPSIFLEDPTISNQGTFTCFAHIYKSMLTHLRNSGLRPGSTEALRQRRALDRPQDRDHRWQQCGVSSATPGTSRIVASNPCFGPHQVVAAAVGTVYCTRLRVSDRKCDRRARAGPYSDSSQDRV